MSDKPTQPTARRCLPRWVPPLGMALTTAIVIPLAWGNYLMMHRALEWLGFIDGN